MFGQPVHRVMREMPATEFVAWAAYRKRFGFAHRHSMLLLARLTHGFHSANRAPDSQPPRLADYLPELAAHEAGEGDEDMKSIEAQQIAALMSRTPRR